MPELLNFVTVRTKGASRSTIDAFMLLNFSTGPRNTPNFATGLQSRPRVTLFSSISSETGKTP